MSDNCLLVPETRTPLAGFELFVFSEQLRPSYLPMVERLLKIQET